MLNIVIPVKKDKDAEKKNSCKFQLSLCHFCRSSFSSLFDEEYIQLAVSALTVQLQTYPPRPSQPQQQELVGWERHRIGKVVGTASDLYPAYLSERTDRMYVCTAGTPTFPHPGETILKTAQFKKHRDIASELRAGRCLGYLSIIKEHRFHNSCWFLKAVCVLTISTQYYVMNYITIKSQSAQIQHADSMTHIHQYLVNCFGIFAFI